MEHKEKYRRVLNELRNKKFTKLKKRKIFLVYIKYNMGRVSAITFPFWVFCWIFVFPISKDYSGGALKGLLAHELSHYELIINMNFFEKVKFAFSWLFTKKGKHKFEEDTDKYVIKKGLGKELLELNRTIEKRVGKEGYKKRSKKGYLSSKQVKNYSGK